MLKIFPDIELIILALVFAALFIQVLDVRGVGLGWVSITALRRADNQGRVKIQPKRRIQRVWEQAAKSVQQHHGVRYAVEGQRPLVTLQKHTDPGACWRGHGGLTVVMPGSISSMCAPQTPRVLIATQQTWLSPTFASNTPVSDADVDPPAAPPLHLPVASITKLSFPAQNLSHWVKALWVRWVRLRLLATVGTLMPLQEKQSGVGSIRV